MWQEISHQKFLGTPSEEEMPRLFQVYRLPKDFPQKVRSLATHLLSPRLAALHLRAMPLPLPPGQALLPAQVPTPAHSLCGMSARVSLSGRLWAAQKRHRLLGQPGARDGRSQVPGVRTAVQDCRRAEEPRRGSPESAELRRVRQGLPFSPAVNVPHGWPCCAVAMPLSGVWDWLSSSAELRQPPEDMWTKNAAHGEYGTLCYCENKRRWINFWSSFTGNICHVVTTPVGIFK